MKANLSASKTKRSLFVERSWLSSRAKAKTSSLPVVETMEERALMTGFSMFGSCFSSQPIKSCAPVQTYNPCPAPTPAPAPGNSCSTPAPGNSCSGSSGGYSGGYSSNAGSTGILAGTVFNDLNKNGVLDGSDSYIQGATVQLFKGGSSGAIATVTTGANGQYVFSNLAPGNYTIVENGPRSYTSTGTDIHAGINTAQASASNVIQATVVDSTKVYANNGGNVTSSYTVVGVMINGQSSLTSAGTLNSSLGTSPGASNLSGTFQTFCADVNTEMSFGGGESYQVKPQFVGNMNNGSSTISADHAGRIAYLFNHYAGANLNSTQGAALQLAIWELLYDNGCTADFTRGNFAIDPNANSYTDQGTLNTVISQATAYFNESSGKSETAMFLNAPAYNCGGEGYQSVLVSNSLNFANVASPPPSSSNSCNTATTRSNRCDNFNWLPSSVGCSSSVSTSSRWGGGYSSFGSFNS